MNNGARQGAGTILLFHSEFNSDTYLSLGRQLLTCDAQERPYGYGKGIPTCSMMPSLHPQIIIDPVANHDVVQKFLQLSLSSEVCAVGLRDWLVGQGE